MKKETIKAMRAIKLDRHAKEKLSWKLNRTFEAEARAKEQYGRYSANYVELQRLLQEYFIMRMPAPARAAWAISPELFCRHDTATYVHDNGAVLYLPFDQGNVPAEQRGARITAEELAALPKRSALKKLLAAFVAERVKEQTDRKALEVLDAKLFGNRYAGHRGLYNLYQLWQAWPAMAKEYCDLYGVVFPTDENSEELIEAKAGDTALVAMANVIPVGEVQRIAAVCGLGWE